ncbi:hypothetical protein D0C36_22920 [Mucilaginibacter conchicola]|uniref:Carboxypeptidase-like regulatory domain-containing protein n=1 Tax=Mucilaginibacter conchicola TaxID=2303333 RepID=A0A372NNA8_9SPHI|nr:hypothetical protein D0C36_22920 [Mucilaginibacter conchicola]
MKKFCNVFLSLVFFAYSSYGQNTKLSGQVLDSTTHLAINNVTVRLETAKSTIRMKQGIFILKNRLGKR